MCAHPLFFSFFFFFFIHSHVFTPFVVTFVSFFRQSSPSDPNPLFLFLPIVFSLLFSLSRKPCSSFITSFLLFSHTHSLSLSLSLSFIPFTPSAHCYTLQPFTPSFTHSLHSILAHRHAFVSHSLPFHFSSPQLLLTRLQLTVHPFYFNGQLLVPVSYFIRRRHSLALCLIAPSCAFITCQERLLSFSLPFPSFPPFPPFLLHSLTYFRSPYAHLDNYPPCSRVRASACLVAPMQEFVMSNSVPPSPCPLFLMLLLLSLPCRTVPLCRSRF
ncbi:hypothetical protein BKA57DRAFT_81106 [Linnemannia elongata]|nr:hypothetical protein BKA57DRAFT_81106 [Linnemannia elongata]